MQWERVRNGGLSSYFPSSPSRPHVFLSQHRWSLIKSLSQSSSLISTGRDTREVLGGKHNYKNQNSRFLSWWHPQAEVLGHLCSSPAPNSDPMFSFMHFPHTYPTTQYDMTGGVFFWSVQFSGEHSNSTPCSFTGLREDTEFADSECSPSLSAFFFYKLASVMSINWYRWYYCTRFGTGNVA